MLTNTQSLPVGQATVEAYTVTVNETTDGRLAVQLWQWMDTEMAWCLMGSSSFDQGQLALEGCDPLEAGLDEFLARAKRRVLDTVRCPF